MLSDSQLSVLKTIAYADVFDYPLAMSEIWRYSVGKSISFGDIKSAIAHLLKRKVIASKDEYFFLPGREKTVAHRVEKTIVNNRKWLLAKRSVGWLKWVPFVKLAGVTGNLAMNNAAEGDDIDLVIIVAFG